MLLRLACPALLLVAVCCRAEADETPVTVHTTDRGVVTGLVDPRTDERALWVRRQTPQILLSNAIPWNVVVAVVHKDVEIEKSVFQRTAANYAVEAKSLFAGPPTRRSFPTGGKADRKSAPVATVAVDAWPASFDRDVEVDGLIVSLAALDRRGAAVAVRGNFSARLVVEEYAVQTGRIRFREGQRWTEQVAVEDFLDGVACYRLPFRVLQPERNLQLRSVALLNVRLSVAGEGNFSASTPVTIRPLDPFRDRLQLETGRRFAAGEIVSPPPTGQLRLPNALAPPWTPHHVIGVTALPSH